jgi:hypothetical protein
MWMSKIVQKRNLIKFKLFLPVDNVVVCNEVSGQPGPFLPKIEAMKLGRQARTQGPSCGGW